MTTTVTSSPPASIVIGGNHKGPVPNGQSIESIESMPSAIQRVFAIPELAHCLLYGNNVLRSSDHRRIQLVSHSLRLACMSMVHLPTLKPAARSQYHHFLSDLPGSIANQGQRVESIVLDYITPELESDIRIHCPNVSKLAVYPQMKWALDLVNFGPLLCSHFTALGHLELGLLDRSLLENDSPLTEKFNEVFAATINVTNDNSRNYPPFLIFPKMTSFTYHGLILTALEMVRLGGRFPNLRTLQGIRWRKLIRPDYTSVLHDTVLSPPERLDGLSFYYPFLTRLETQFTHDHALWDMILNIPRLRDLELWGYMPGYGGPCSWLNGLFDTILDTRFKDKGSYRRYASFPSLRLRTLSWKGLDGWIAMPLEPEQKVLRHPIMSKVERLNIYQSVCAFVRCSFQDVTTVVDDKNDRSSKSKDLVYHYRLAQEQRASMASKKELWFPWGATLRSLDLSGRTHTCRLIPVDCIRMNRILREELPVLVELSIRQSLDSYALFSGLGDDAAVVRARKGGDVHNHDDDRTAIIFSPSSRPQLEKLSIWFSDDFGVEPEEIEREICLRFKKSLLNLVMRTIRGKPGLIKWVQSVNISEGPVQIELLVQASNAREPQKGSTDQWHF
ncbi:hypothetical protein BGZ83_005338 [Gryganskiella cystojenkinii]|nr:hypothetical protein BGZ83_005338 [Gryganskiella cystojenkinii]